MRRAKAGISPQQQSLPLHGTSYFKTKAFSYCIPGTHTPCLFSLSSARSSCVLPKEHQSSLSNVEGTEMKMMWVCTICVMAQMFMGDHGSKCGEPIFVKTCSFFPTWHSLNLDQVWCLPIRIAVLAQGG